MFCKASPIAVQKVMQAFHQFSAVSGLVANKTKSSLYMGGIPESQKKVLLELTAFSRDTFPMKYLALTSKKWSKSDCFKLVQKITDKLDLWSAKNLSYDGRRVLVQSVLQAMSNYWSSMFIIPQSIVKMVDESCRKFLWGTKNSEKVIPLVNWEQVCTPKENGGLGLKSCGLWNKVMIGKQV